MRALSLDDFKFAQAVMRGANQVLVEGHLLPLNKTILLTEVSLDEGRLFLTFSYGERHLRLPIMETLYEIWSVRCQGILEETLVLWVRKSEE